MIKPTDQEKLSTFKELALLNARRLIQFMDARNAVLKVLDPKKDEKGNKPPPDIEEAIRILNETKELR